jgi:hypothetical protein
VGANLGLSGTDSAVLSADQLTVTLGDTSEITSTEAANIAQYAAQNGAKDVTIATTSAKYTIENGTVTVNVLDDSASSAVLAAGKVLATASAAVANTTPTVKMISGDYETAATITPGTLTVWQNTDLQAILADNIDTLVQGVTTTAGTWHTSAEVSGNTGSVTVNGHEVTSFPYGTISFSLYGMSDTSSGVSVAGVSSFVMSALNKNNDKLSSVNGELQLTGDHLTYYVPVTYTTYPSAADSALGTNGTVVYGVATVVVVNPVVTKDLTISVGSTVPTDAASYLTTLIGTNGLPVDLSGNVSGLTIDTTGVNPNVAGTYTVTVTYTATVAGTPTSQ